MKNAWLIVTLCAALCRNLPSRRNNLRPNVVFILADDLGWADTTLYGHTKFYKTPNLERLAKRGMTFSRAYSASPLCSPTRSANSYIMTSAHSPVRSVRNECSVRTLHSSQQTWKLIKTLSSLFLITLCVAIAQEAPAASPPNLIYIMADELGYYEPGFMGGKNIQTPNLDKMAAEGIIFRDLFAGSSVCAPTRCCFLTGKHSGHTSVRANGGGTPLRAEEETIASMLKPLGYATGGFGKWGCGGRDSTGVPEKHGFDVFLGYYDQVHAHTYYPPYLIRNSEEVPLAGNSGGSQGKTYSQYVIHAGGDQVYPRAP